MSWRAKSHWGSCVWALIHTITVIDYDEPQSQLHFVKQTLERLQTIESFILCKYCANHYREYLEKLDKEEVMKPMRLFEYMVDFHNQVNKKLNKPEMSLEEAKELWAKKV